jgi:hypothetical protein
MIYNLTSAKTLSVEVLKLFKTINPALSLNVFSAKGLVILTSSLLNYLPLRRVFFQAGGFSFHQSCDTISHAL